MGRSIHIEVIEPSALGPAEQALWASFRAASPSLANPYFDIRYALTAGRICPGAQVAVLYSGDRIDGFLPFQRRGGLIQPLGAPLTDYHGIIGRPGVEIDLAEVVRDLGAARFRFNGLKTGAAPKGAAAHQAVVADLSNGFDAYVEARRAAGHGDFFKDKRRRLKNLERDHAPVAFSFGGGDHAALDFILELKRDQLRRDGQHDVFDCGWTERLLRTLLDHPDPDFGARIAVLRAGDAIVAAEIGLISGGAYHLWFPVYDPAYARYSPGQLMTLETLRAASELGVASVDFGPAGETYKRAFADAGETVYEGDILSSPMVAAVSTALGFRAQRLKLGRRIDRILACEPQLTGQVVAASKYAGVIARRHTGLTAAAAATTAALGLGLGLAFAVE